MKAAEAIPWMCLLWACAPHPAQQPRGQPPGANGPSCQDKAVDDAQAAHACLTRAESFPEPPVPYAKGQRLLRGLCSEVQLAGVAGCRCQELVGVSGTQAVAELAHFVEGSFSSPGANEVLLFFRGCADTLDSVDLLLARRTERGSERVVYLPRFDAGPCRPTRPSLGISKLACRTATRSEAGTELHVELLDFEHARRQRLFSLVDNQEDACRDGRLGVLQSAGLTAFGFSDLNGDGQEDLWTDILYARGPEPATYAALCAKRAEPTVADSPALDALACQMPDTHCSRIELVARDTSFVATPAAAALLASLAARGPSALPLTAHTEPERLPR